MSTEKSAVPRQIFEDIVLEIELLRRNEKSSKRPCTTQHKDKRSFGPREVFVVDLIQRAPVPASDASPSTDDAGYSSRSCCMTFCATLIYD
jgi:hypothetical protein